MRRLSACVKPQVPVGGEDGAHLPPPTHPSSVTVLALEPCWSWSSSQETRTSGPSARLPGPRGLCLSGARSAARRGQYWEGLSGPEASSSHQRSGEEPPPPIQPVGCGHTWSNVVSRSAEVKPLWKKSTSTSPPASTVAGALPP